MSTKHHWIRIKSKSKSIVRNTLVIMSSILDNCGNVRLSSWVYKLYCKICSNMLVPFQQFRFKWLFFSGAMTVHKILIQANTTNKWNAGRNFNGCVLPLRTLIPQWIWLKRKIDSKYSLNHFAMLIQSKYLNCIHN